MASEADVPSPLATPLGTTLVAVCVTGWLLAGVIALTRAPLLVGSTFGVVAVAVTLFYWGWTR